MIKRILMTADAVGGVWTYALELASALGEYGYEVHLATMGPPPRMEQRIAAQVIPGLTLHESSYRLEWMDDAWEDVSDAGEWLLDLEDAIKPDIIHLNGYCHASLPWMAPTVVVCHSCVLSWWRAVKEDHAPTEWRRYGFEVARGLRAATAVVAPSHAMLDEIRNCYGPVALARVIPNGVSLSPRISTKEPFVLAAGRVWDEAKNISALEEIAEELSWEVRIAGDNDGRASSGRYLGRLSQNDMAAEMAKASIYALPAKYEPFGLSILEAALAGCALVLGDIPSLRENWSGVARFVNPKDPQSLKNQIQSLIDDSAERLALARRSQSRARHFTATRMASNYLALYKELLSLRRAGFRLEKTS